MRPFASYLATAIAGIALVGYAVWIFTEPTVRSSILVSAGLALAIQMAAFAIARSLRHRHVLLGWGLGSVLRLIALVLYAVFIARLWRPSLSPALLSFAAFLFVSMLVEPVFLKR